MFVVKYRKIWFTLSAVLFALSIGGMWIYGFNTSIDFKGGSITEVSYEAKRPDKEGIERALSTLNIGGFSLRASGEDRYIVRTKELSEEEKVELHRALGSENSTYLVERENTIGPVAGAELKSKALKAVAVVVIMIVLFITFAFRKVFPPAGPGGQANLPRSWKYGLATVVALLHDVVIPTGLFVFLGHVAGVEIDLLFVTGLLAILGYSVHDTIVVFDRVRENLTLNKNQPFEDVVGKSVSQTFGRSINTSLTIFITLLALYLFGSMATKDFALLLLVGIVVGTYSSIFIASPLLVTFYNWNKEKNA